MYKRQLVYITEEMLNNCGKTLKGSTVVISGSGNVATYAVEKAQQMGAKVVTVSDSDGYAICKFLLSMPGPPTIGWLSINTRF